MRARHRQAYRTDARAKLFSLAIGLKQSFNSLNSQQITGLDYYKTLDRYQKSLSEYYARLQNRAR